ncbi:MAG: hypothetical protein KDD73_02010 [Anaerolineales bacterium]|nr:hypothetical protein [Anaerolineales bacterium]
MHPLLKRTRFFFLTLALLLTVSGCSLLNSGRPEDAISQVVMVRDATMVDAMVYDSLLQLLSAGLTDWEQLPRDRQEQLWELLVPSQPVPEQKISILSVQQLSSVQALDLTTDNRAVAWRPFDPTEIAPSRADAEVGPRVPSRAQNEVRAAQPVDDATISDVVGFDVGAEVPLPSAPLSLQLPRETRLIAAPLVVYRAVPFEGAEGNEGYAYEVAALYLVAFGVAR